MAIQILFSGEMGGGGLLGPGEQADLASLAVEIVIGEPGSDPQVIRHVIVDRLTAEQRAGEAIGPDDLAPVADDDGTPAVFRSILHLLVSTGGSDPRSYAIDRGFAAAMAAWGADQADDDTLTLNEAVVPAVVADQSMVVASEQRFLPAIDDAETRAYVAAPRVYLTTRSIGLDDLAQQVVRTDLMRDGIRTLPRDGAPADAPARHRLWYGALAGAFESEYILANAGQLDPTGRVIEGVSFDMGKPLAVVTGEDELLPVAADTSLATILAAGGLAVVPGEITTAATWWEISPDATTRSVLAPRLGGGGVRGPGAPRPSTIKPVGPADKPRDQRKQKDEGGNAGEYGTLVDKVGRNVEKAARTGGRIVRDGWDDVAKPLVKL